jgi:hypothetical protein
MRDIYDPSGQMTEPDGLFYQEVARRHHTVQLLGHGAISGSEVVLANSLHAGLEAPAPALDMIVPDRSAQITDAIYARADKTVNHIAGIAERHCTQVGDYVDSFPGGACDPMLLAVRSLAHIAHHDVWRRSGKPYTSHTEGVAAILDAAWNMSEQNPDDYDRLRLYKAIAYLHDAPEDTMDVGGEYLADPVIASPLVIGRLLMHYGMPEAKAHDAARATLLLNNGRGMTDKQPYRDYVVRGARIGGFWFSMIKAGDLRHNSAIDAEDPARSADPARVLARRVKYETCGNVLLAETDAYELTDGAQMIRAVLTVDERTMQRNFVDRLRPIKLEPGDLDLAA